MGRLQNTDNLRLRTLVDRSHGIVFHSVAISFRPSNGYRSVVLKARPASREPRTQQEGRENQESPGGSQSGVGAVYTIVRTDQDAKWALRENINERDWRAHGNGRTGYPEMWREITMSPGDVPELISSSRDRKPHQSESRLRNGQPATLGSLIAALIRQAAANPS